jgi:[acyl-carrier-protein] S-malonyltransferase
MAMIAVVFPGQGSQRPGMGVSLAEASAAAASVFKEASAAVGTDVLRLCSDSDDEALRLTQNAQIALYACGLAAWAALQERTGLTPAAFAGHSVGEYAAVVASGVLDPGAGASLVRARGEIMARAGANRPGSMAAVLGMERSDLEKVCADVGDRGVVVVANDNAPGQLVVSGDNGAVQAAGALAMKRGAKRVVPLNVSGAFHSPLMADSAEEMGQVLAVAPFRPDEQVVPVYPNLTAERVDRGGDWPRLLKEQLTSPVRWTESVRAMSQSGIDTFVECGSGDVLTGLIRRTTPGSTVIRVVDEATLRDAASHLSQGVLS